MSVQSSSSHLHSPHPHPPPPWFWNPIKSFRQIQPELNSLTHVIPATFIEIGTKIEKRIKLVSPWRRAAVMQPLCSAGYIGQVSCGGYHTAALICPTSPCSTVTVFWQRGHSDMGNCRHCPRKVIQDISGRPIPPRMLLLGQGTALLVRHR